MRAYKAKQYVRQTQMSKQYKCANCEYIVEKVCKCIGICGKTFCLQCLKYIERTKGKCPYNCPKPFQATEPKSFQLQYICPFNDEKCETPVLSVEAFYEHDRSCKFVPQNWKYQQENYNKYRCKQGYILFFLDHKQLKNLFGEARMKSKKIDSCCAQCKDETLCRSICPQCSSEDNHQVYCGSCRKPPCTTFTCLYEHKFTTTFHYNVLDFRCDFCGIAICLLEWPFFYQDRECDFDICEGCYDSIPETHQLVPFTMPRSVISHLIAGPLFSIPFSSAFSMVESSPNINLPIPLNSSTSATSSNSTMTGNGSYEESYFSHDLNNSGFTQAQ